ncbi:hypothetical protein PUV54_14080 [Hyphococcus flavus]|uniref:Uncharacterized protein n=1 Tax=Hyphococcus flavus TaxID=1866326 RepID=A0AAE9ZIP9_9PROT|nr:hypothetical protein [Hyphococcus flavus]WDI31080.1 hypothetical protein PUV54_14080 [Hyphococcus flavus]
MPYGVKRGVKTPGNFTAGDMMGLALSGSAGIIAALVTDYQQSGEASALFTINQWVVQLGSILGFTDIPLWMVVVGMTMVGAGSVFYFQPITRQGAFAQGFGLLAVLMTAVPANLASGLQGINDTLPGLETVSTTREASVEAKVHKASYSPQGTVTLVQDRDGPSMYDVHLTINFPNGISDQVSTMIRRGELRGRLHNEDTNQTWDLFKSTGGTVRQSGNSLVIHAGVPARSQNAQLWVRIEAKGYAIQIQSYSASLSDVVEWDIEMVPSSTPLFIQRLGKSYWF